VDAVDEEIEGGRSRAQCQHGEEVMAVWKSETARRKEERRNPSLRADRKAIDYTLWWFPEIRPRLSLRLAVL
jgi:hypothetical protein